MPALADYDVLSFDCYGTLIDWETGILAALALWRARLAPGHRPDPGEILAAFGRHEAAVEAAAPTMPYPEVLAGVLQGLGEEFGTPATPAETRAFGASVPDWPPFADSANALARLSRRYRLVILSNVDRASIAASASRLGDPFWRIYTAEEIGSYKPDHRNFRHLLAGLAAAGVAAARVLHCAQSLYHDHVPAAQLGLATCWIDRPSRYGGPGASRAPEAPPRVDFRFASLEELAAAAG